MPTDSKLNANSQRGAALLSTLLISALLLGAGGMLLLTTSMAGTSTIDSAAEMQAYYGAEAGIQATLNVLRGNVMPNPLFASNPAGGVAPENRMSLRKAVTKATSNLSGDPTTAGFPARLSRWLAYNYTPPGFTYSDRVAITAGYTPFSGIAYSVSVTDPDNTPAADIPTRLIVTATGYGPRGARKTLSMIVSGNGLGIEIPATLTLRGHDDGVTSAIIDLGSSADKLYSGHDYSEEDPVRPSIAVNAHDVDVAEAAYASKPDTVTDPKYKVLDLESEPAPPLLAVPPPWFLETANDARSFLVAAEAIAHKQGTVVTSLNGAAGSQASPQITFVKGNCNLDSGAGLLIVTGTLSTNGNPSFYGTILVLGEGRVLRSGGGSGDILGSVTIARFGATGGFLEPTYTISGGGNSTMQYDSTAFQQSVALMGAKALGIAEK